MAGALLAALVAGGVYGRAVVTARGDDDELLAADDPDDAGGAGASEEAIAARRAVADALQNAARSASSPVLQIAAAAASSAVPAAAASGAASDPVATPQARVHRLERQLAREHEAAERAAHAQNWHERLRRLGLTSASATAGSPVYSRCCPPGGAARRWASGCSACVRASITGKPMTPMLNSRKPAATWPAWPPAAWAWCSCCGTRTARACRTRPPRTPWWSTSARHRARGGAGPPARRPAHRPARRHPHRHPHRPAHPR
ncbi:MAG: hypothetical protein U1F53_17025 [Burkholderiaceae bacterium]